MRRSIDDALDDHPDDDEDRGPVSWAVALSDDCDACADPRVEVDSFQGLLVHYTRKKGVHLILRGLRAVSDFEYEFQLANMNRKLDPEFDTVFMMTGQDSFYISSQLVREVASLGGDVSELVPPNVFRALREKFPSRNGG